MNEIVHTFLLAGDKFMPEMHLKKPTALSKLEFTYSASEPFTKNKERFPKIKKKITEETKYIYKNEVDIACFQHDMTYGDFKDLAKRIVSDKVLRDEAFNTAKSPKYDGY